VPLCSPHTWQRVAISVRTVVPRARLEVWIGESAASSWVTTRPVASGQWRSRWEDCLYPPLPPLLPLWPASTTVAGHDSPHPGRPLGSLLPLPDSPALCWRMPGPDASPHRHAPTLRPPPGCRPSTRTPLASLSAPRSYGSVCPLEPSRLCPPLSPAAPLSCLPPSAAAAPSQPTCMPSLPGCGSAR
jgi:hypothetical protein